MKNEKQDNVPLAPEKGWGVASDLPAEKSSTPGPSPEGEGRRKLGLRYGAGR
jgi:hypothetical protein